MFPLRLSSQLGSVLRYSPLAKLIKGRSISDKDVSFRGTGTKLFCGFSRHYFSTLRTICVCRGNRLLYRQKFVLERVSDKDHVRISACHFSSMNKENLLLNHLKARIKMLGPMAIADYMKEVLTNSLSGYYMNKDVFGSAGDFITSPEISQMFGEMLGIWVLNEWMNNYNGKHLQIVEMGPGRGTLADDMLRVFSQFKDIDDHISLHLVEISPALSGIQAAKLCDDNNVAVSHETQPSSELSEGETPGPYMECKSKYGPKVKWYKELSHVPLGLSCYIGHEFLDALPIHKFHKSDRGWREVMVDVDPDSGGLRFVLAPAQTPASVAFLKVSPEETRTNIEVCPAAAVVVEEICRRIKQHGGFSLLADYGHTGEKGGTFRAFRNHQLHDPLIDPGNADLTADVDFAYLKQAVSSDVSVFGPITQEQFLTNMGIGFRLQALLQKASQDQWSGLVSGFKMLTSPEQMGERFKFLCIMEKKNADYLPAGFAELELDKKSSKTDY